MALGRITNTDIIKGEIAEWDKQHVRIYLEMANAWRRGADMVQPNPFILGLVVDRAIVLLQ